MICGSNATANRQTLIFKEIMNFNLLDMIFVGSLCFVLGASYVFIGFKKFLYMTIDKTDFRKEF